MCELYLHNTVLLKNTKTTVLWNTCLNSKIMKKIKEMNSIKLRTVVSYGREKGLS